MLRNGWLQEEHCNVLQTLWLASEMNDGEVLTIRGKG